MKCKTAEKWILWSLDGRLDERRKSLLDDHLRTCPACRRLDVEYRAMMALLHESNGEAALPRFWGRLEPRLKEERKLVPLVLWERWALHAIPVFVALVVLAAALFIFTPQTREVSQSETLLIENTNPFTETKNLFEQRPPERRSMMLIFASLDEKPSARRRIP